MVTVERESERKRVRDTISLCKLPSLNSRIILISLLPLRFLPPLQPPPSPASTAHLSLSVLVKQRPIPRWCNWLPLTTLTAGIPCQQLRKLLLPPPPHLQTANEGGGRVAGPWRGGGEGIGRWKNGRNIPASSYRLRISRN